MLKFEKDGNKDRVGERVRKEEVWQKEKDRGKIHVKVQGKRERDTLRRKRSK